MERLLFLDACVRGPELSRTWRLCQRFLEEYTTLHPQAQVCHRDLRESLPILTGELARQRDGWIARGEDDPRLTPAREIASADSEPGRTSRDRTTEVRLRIEPNRSLFLVEKIRSNQHTSTKN